MGRRGQSDKWKRSVQCLKKRQVLHRSIKRPGGKADCSEGMGYQGRWEGHDDLGKGIKLHCFPLQHTVSFYLGQASRGIMKGQLPLFGGTSIHYLKNRNCY